MMNENALKERLKTIAAVENRTFHVVWKQLLLERILARLSRSKFSEQFIFKGGLLLSQYIAIGRETQDIDFLNRATQSNEELVKSAFDNILSINLSDGFDYNLLNISILAQPHMPQSGFRLKVSAQFGSMKDIVFIDLGTGDNIHPTQELFSLVQYQGKPLFKDVISLHVYPIEAIFADKLDSVFSRGQSNSRMKDFHDLLLLCRTTIFIDPPKIQNYLSVIFKRRSKPFKLPIRFAPAAYVKMQPIWEKYQKGLGTIATSLKIPGTIQETVDEINIWLEQHLHII